MLRYLCAAWFKDVELAASSTVHVSVVNEESLEEAGLSLCLMNVGRSVEQTCQD